MELTSIRRIDIRNIQNNFELLLHLFSIHLHLYQHVENRNSVKDKWNIVTEFWINFEIYLFYF